MDELNPDDTGMDTMLSPPTGAMTLANLVSLLRPGVHKAVAGPGAADPADVEEVLTQLLAYACAVEKVLAEAAGTSGTMPGHAVSVRSYVEQVLSGEARQTSRARMANYFLDALTFFMKTHAGVEKAMDQFATQLAEALRPSHIENRVQASGLLRMFGLHEGAYWREFCRQFRSLDAAGIQQLARNQSRRP